MDEKLRAKVLGLWGPEKLEDVTPENWPWFHERWVKGERTFEMPDMLTGEMVQEREDILKATPYMPDFANDDAAAVRLAQQMNLRVSEIVTLHPPHKARAQWTLALGRKCYRAPTLGAVLLVALEASE